MEVQTHMSGHYCPRRVGTTQPAGGDHTQMMSFPAAGAAARQLQHDSG